MKQGTFMAIAAVLAFAFGLAWILVPGPTMASYGITLTAGGEWLGRYLGSAFIGIAVLTWRARNVTQGDAIRAIVLGDFVLSITGLVVSVLNRFYGPGNALGWSTVAIYLFLTLGFGYFQFVKPLDS